MSWNHVLAKDTNGYPTTINNVDVLTLPEEQGPVHSFLHNDHAGRWSWQTVDGSWITGLIPVGVLALTDSHLFVGNASNIASDVAMSGDATIANTGALTIANGAVTLAKMADMATASLIYRKTAGTGVPEINTLATLKTDLGTMPPSAHDILSTTHGDTTAAGAVRGDLITAQGASPLWTRLAIDVPESGTLNYLGINNDETESAWKSASANPGAAAMILQTSTAGDVTLQHLNLAATSNQLVMQSAGVTGTLTWTPATSNKTITLPNSTGTMALVGLGALGNASAQYHVPVSGATPFAYAESGFLLDGTTGGKTVLAVTNAKILTLTATDSRSVTFPIVSTNTDAITTSANPGAAASILSSAPTTGLLTLAQLTVTNAPTFSAMTAGSVLFAGASGVLSQDNANFYWNNTIKKLNIGAATSDPGSIFTQLVADGNANVPGCVDVVGYANQATNKNYYLWGGQFAVLNIGAGDLQNNMTGLYATAIQVGTGAITLMRGAYYQTIFIGANGNVTQSDALVVGSSFLGYTGTVAANSGLHFNNVGDARVTVSRAIWIDAQSGSGTNYAIDCEGGLVKIVLPTSAAGLPAGCLWNNGGVVNVA